MKCHGNNISWMKKRSQRRKHCTLAVVRRRQKCPPATDPFPGVWDGQNLISWRWSLPTNPVWWGLMHPISSYRGNRPTNTRTHTHKQTNPQIGPITIHCAAKLSAQCNKLAFLSMQKLFTTITIILSVSVSLQVSPAAPKVCQRINFCWY